MNAGPRPSTEKELRADVLRGLAEGAPQVGPIQVHIDVTNRCNAACITCWDHSPLLKIARSKAWKGQRLPWETFERLMTDLDALGSVRAVVLSGMGEPLTHPRIYEMMAAVKLRGWHLTVLTNLLAADLDRLCDAGVDNLLVGVHGATPEAYAAFHPGWDESDFFRMTRGLKALANAGVRTRHVQVINRDTAPDVPAMVRFGQRFEADRVNYKLASLAGGTEDCAITPEQRIWLRDEAVPEARRLSEELGVRTNLGLFARQLEAASDSVVEVTAMDDVGCAMGFAYTRVAVDGTVLYCCNTSIPVGRVGEGSLRSQWFGPRWQGVREQIGRGEWFAGCERCGKFEQNVKWGERQRAQGLVPFGAKR
ncbi:MAG: radical SAM protein [Deltaproteobacteria bacterium]|nr:radical SAM protein [Deltaproteobacteria bacterium]